MALRIVIAGGGTGGHLFPGIAIAQAFQARDWQTRIRFVGTGRPFEKAALHRENFVHIALKMAGFKGRTRVEQIKALGHLPGSLWRSVSLLLRFRPRLVVGVGGYSAFPVVLAAWLLGIKRVLHEQNISAGLTNRLLALVANRVYVSFEGTRRLPARRRQRVTGNPLRRDLYQAAAAEVEGGQSRKAQKQFTLLVLGGSQGAHGINTAMVAAAGIWPGMRALNVVHQTGAADCETVRRAYARIGVRAEVAAFFKDMAKRYRQADLVIARAGATTVAEISAMGKAAVFIPFPFAADDHQTGNARALVTAGAAGMIPERDLNGQRLAAKIRHLHHNRTALAQMAQAARTCGRPRAAEAIVADCYDLLRIDPAHGGRGGLSDEDI